MGYNVLIADDEVLVRRGLVTLIEQEAPELTIVGVAVDGLDALELAENSRLDIVLTDIRMPGLDGLELIARLRTDQPELRCIILSGYDEFAYAQRAIGLGVQDYLLKPIDPDDLLATLARAQQSIHAERATRRLLATTRQIAVEQALRRLLDGQPVDLQTLEACLPATPAWGLLLLSALPATVCRAELVTACREILATSTVLEDAYGYVGMLLPLPEAQTGLVSKAAAELQGTLRGAGWQVSVVAARPCTALATLGAAYSEALQVAEYAFVPESGAPILTWEILAPVREQWPMLPAAQRDALLAAVSAGLEDDAGRAAHAFIAHLTGHLPPGAVRALWLEIVVLVMYHVQQLGVRATDVLEPGQDLRALLAETCDAVCMADRLARLARRAAAASGRLKQQQAPRGTIPELRAYIAAHLGDDLTITTLARHLHLSAKYLGELFKQVTGESLGAYIIRMRMYRACELLSSTDLKIYGIAEHVGYTDPKHFAGMFRSVIGIPPGEYREQHRPRPLTALESSCNA